MRTFETKNTEGDSNNCKWCGAATCEIGKMCQNVAMSRTTNCVLPISPSVGTLSPIKEVKEEYQEDGTKVKVLVNGYNENHKQKIERLREVLANPKANGYYTCWAYAVWEGSAELPEKVTIANMEVTFSEGLRNADAR